MPKKNGLVFQHLERIDVGALERYQEIIRAYVRKREGVYALYRKGQLYYVGLASDLKWRLAAHLKDRHKAKWDSFSIYLTANSPYLRELESLMLRVFSPKGNKISGKFAVSENLARRFKKDVNEYYKHEVRKLFGLGSRRKAILDRPDSLLARHIQQTGQSLWLRAIYKKKTYRAVVEKDGTVRFKNRKYPTPSAAGRAVIQRACNGWAFWRYEQVPGQWIRLSELRRIVKSR